MQQKLNIYDQKNCGYSKKLNGSFLTRIMYLYPKAITIANKYERNLRVWERETDNDTSLFMKATEKKEDLFSHFFLTLQNNYNNKIK